MTEASKSNEIATLFPNPPPFWQHFTSENLRRIEESRHAESGPYGSQTQPDSRLSSGLPRLSSDMRFLHPPELPTDGNYRCFGDNYNLLESLPSLAEQNITQLYTLSRYPDGTSQSDIALILKRLAKSLILNFLELIGIMSLEPEQHIEKIKDIREIFINFHHLLNEFRPHQARESLILMMQDQLDRANAETEAMLKTKVEVDAVLNGLNNLQLSSGERTDEVSTESSGWDDKDDWALLGREYG